MVNIFKDIKIGQESREKIQIGVNTVANVVKETLGPCGRNVIIEKGIGQSYITKDGVSIAKEVFLKDRFENIGAQLVKQVSEQSAIEAGDGTTTATVLAQSLINEGNKLILSEMNPMLLKKGMELALEDFINYLKTISKPVSSKNDIENIAIISSNGDLEIGKLVSDAMEKTGDYKTISVKESDTNETTLEVVDGLEFDRGIMSPYMINDFEKNQIVHDNCYILLIDKKLTDFQNDLSNILTKVIKENKLPLLIIAEDYLGNVMPNLLINILGDSKKGYMGKPIAFVKAPGYGERRLQLLEDIAALTGAKVVTNDKGININEADTSVLGKVERVEIKQFSTVLIGGHANKEELNNRILYLQKQLEVIPTEVDKEQYRERISKLMGGIAVIRVGGKTEAEVKEKKDRVDDAVCATKSAKEEGIVPGGASVYYTYSLNEEIHNDINNYEIQAGFNLFKKACQAPIKQILNNVGVSNVEKVLCDIKLDNIYDARNKVFVNPYTSGIIDPTKVIRCAAENAVSIASLILTSSASIVLDEE